MLDLPIEDNEVMTDFQFEKFWTVSGTGKRTSIHTTKLWDIVKHLGFRRIKVNDASVIAKIDFDSYQIETFDDKDLEMRSIISEVPRFLRNNQSKYVEKHSLVGVEFDNMVDTLSKDVDTLFKLKFFDTMDLIEDSLPMYKDDEHSAFFFFINGILEVTASKVKFTSYHYLNKFHSTNTINPKFIPKYIWKNDIIQHRYNDFTDLAKAKEKSDFYKFLEKLAYSIDDPLNETKMNNLKRSIGYLMHAYKKPSLPKLIVITENNLSDEAKGGTGKGILVEAISKLRTVLSISGKNFDPSNKFVFQNVEVNVKVIHIDDGEKGLQLEPFFTMLTGTLDVEMKNKKNMKIPFANSPKFVISTNHDVLGYSDSDNRRKHYIEVEPYFSKSYTPIMEFGKELFTNWSNKEWESFFPIMLDCVQLYLKDGLIEYNSNTLTKKKVIKAVGGLQFYNWFEELQKDTYYNFKYYIDSFVEAHGESQRYANKTAIGTKVRKYCELMGYEWVEIRESHGSRERKYQISTKRKAS